jgi:cytidylate kinase
MANRGKGASMAIVTISRKCGTGAREVARAVAKRLRYEFVGKESIYKEIEVYGKEWLDWVARLDDRAPTLLERYDQSHAAYLALVEHCIYVNALKNDVVILGRGGNYLLEKIPYSLRVRITASAKDRGKVLCDRFGIDEAAARKMVTQSDHERSIYIKRGYHRNWDNPDDYDMVLNSGRMGFDELVAQIVGEIPARDRLFTPETEEQLRRLELASRVKVEIITRFYMFISTLEAHHDGTAIVLRGVCLLTKEKARELMETAVRSAGATRIRNELYTGPPAGEES